MIALELGIAFVTGGLIGAILMAMVALRSHDRFEIENARLRRSNRELQAMVDESIATLNSSAETVRGVSQRIARLDKEPL